ncbi:unnamed protein product [Amoebophrya sp. A120]|nr:unnamed protein product [Amoebophrya sp. A120]|eukprot:GSA120T00001213001.1
MPSPASANIASDGAAAVRLFKEKRFSESLPFFDKFLAANPNDEVGFSNRAQAYLELKRYDEALQDADRSIEINCLYAKAYKRKADALVGVGKKEEALKVLLKAHKMFSWWSAAGETDLVEVGAKGMLQLRGPMVKLNEELGNYVPDVENSLKAKTSMHAVSNVLATAGMLSEALSEVEEIEQMYICRARAQQPDADAGQVAKLLKSFEGEAAYFWMLFTKADLRIVLRRDDDATAIKRFEQLTQLLLSSLRPSRKNQPARINPIETIAGNTIKNLRFLYQQNGMREKERTLVAQVENLDPTLLDSPAFQGHASLKQAKKHVDAANAFLNFEARKKCKAPTCDLEGAATELRLAIDILEQPFLECGRSPWSWLKMPPTVEEQKQLFAESRARGGNPSSIYALVMDVAEVRRLILLQKRNPGCSQTVADTLSEEAMNLCQQVVTLGDASVCRGVTQRFVNSARRDLANIFDDADAFRRVAINEECPMCMKSFSLSPDEEEVAETSVLPSTSSSGITATAATAQFDSGHDLHFGPQAIISKRRNKAYVLECNHAVCLECLHQYVCSDSTHSGMGSARKICPTCRDPFPPQIWLGDTLFSEKYPGWIVANFFDCGRQKYIGEDEVEAAEELIRLSYEVEEG